MKKKLLIILPILGGIIIGGAVAAVLLWPKAPDAEEIFAEADRLSEQNLCLRYRLQEDPSDEESRRQLLLNFAVLGADPLTILGTKGEYDITLPEVEVQREEAGAVLGAGGIIDRGVKMTDYADCGAVVTDGETVYYATGDGIYADYHGLKVKLVGARAERMMAAENGLYFLNATARRVQYLARDGHRIETVSPISALDFAFLEGKLWIAGRDGKVYCDGVAVESAAMRELCVLDGVLYGICEEGIAEVGGAVLLHSPAFGLVAGDALYYIDRYGYPARLDPLLKESAILREEEVVAVGYSEGKAYYLNQKRKVGRV